MGQSVSVGNKIKLIHGLADTIDVTAWENRFIHSIWGQSQEGKKTSHLSEAQLESIDRIYDTHFGGSGDRSSKGSSMPR